MIPDKAFIKLHGVEPKAVTMPSDNKVDFSKGFFSKAVVLHELMHCYYDTCLLTDSALKKDQVEEVMCKIIEHHYNEIGQNADFIFKELNPNV